MQARDICPIMMRYGDKRLVISVSKKETIFITYKKIQSIDLNEPNIVTITTNSAIYNIKFQSYDYLKAFKDPPYGDAEYYTKVENDKGSQWHSIDRVYYTLCSAAADDM